MCVWHLLWLFSCSVMSGSLQLHGLQHSRFPSPSPSPRVCSSSCPLCWCFYLTISSSAAPFFFFYSVLQDLFQWVSSSHQMAKVLELQLQHQSSNEYSGLISFRINWFDLLAVQGTLKSLLQHYSSKASVLWRSAFFMVQLSHLYMTIGKTIALTIWTFVGKVMSLLFNALSRFVIGFLSRSKHLLISWLQSLSEPQK